MGNMCLSYTRHVRPHTWCPPQVGEFYEAIGTDAVVLVQWAGLNPMGSTHMPPRAGCPHMNIRRTLQSLVEEANLSVVRLLPSLLRHCRPVSVTADTACKCLRC